MATYLQLVKFVTLLYSICSIAASDDLDGMLDMDFGDENMLLNTLASAFLKGAGDSDGDCTYTCPSGVKPQRNPSYVAVPNGCGAYGMKLDLSKLPNIEKCCMKHDVCYGTCNKKQAKCDQSFNKCLNNVCDDLRGDMDLTDEETEGCQMVAQLMVSTVQGLGCGAYLDSQKEACSCPKMSNKTRKNEL